jgi:internalin A
MTPDEALAEARRRIAAARASNATLLDLGDLGLEEIPPEIGELAALRVLALGGWKPIDGDNGIEWEWDYDRPDPPLTDLGPLRGLTALASLNLDGCDQLTDLGPLRGLTALASLDLRGYGGVTDLGPLRGLTALASLDLGECGGLREFAPPPAAGPFD